MIMKGYDNMRKFFTLLISLTILLTTILYRFGDANIEKNFFSASKNDSSISIEYKNIKISDIESIIEYGKHLVIAAHYPVFGINSIDLVTKDLINNYMNNFKDLFKDVSILDTNYKSELNIDYEIYNPYNNIVSIKFTIIENMYYYAHPNVVIHTLNYDLDNNKQIHLKNIMKGKYLEKISEISLNHFKNIAGYKDYINTDNFNNGIASKYYNYSNFILNNDKIIFIFQKYQLFPGVFGITTIEIPYSLLNEYLKPNFLKLDSFETLSFKGSFDIRSNNINTFSETKLKPQRKIDPKKPMVALTFDDGPYTRSTLLILNTLKEHNSVATFFVLGNRVSNHQDIIKQMAKQGNEIGNHTYSHKQLTNLTSKELKEQVNKTQNIILGVTGNKPKIMRPTYGSYDNKLRSEINLPMILWSIDPMDWKTQDPEKIANHILSRVKDGDIILMHDIFKATADAVELLIPELLNRGFQLVTVSELYETKGRVLQVGKIYSHVRKR